METTMTVSSVLVQSAEVATVLGPYVGIVLAFAFGPKLMKVAVKMILNRDMGRVKRLRKRYGDEWVDHW